MSEIACFLWVFFFSGFVIIGSGSLHNASQPTNIYPTTNPIQVSNPTYSIQPTILYHSLHIHIFIWSSPNIILYCHCSCCRIYNYLTYPPLKNSKHSTSDGIVEVHTYTRLRKRKEQKWFTPGSNRRPLACEANALPTAPANH